MVGAEPVTAQVRICCDAPFCEQTSTAWLADVPKHRRKLKSLGWVKARTNNRDADYCPDHANYRTKQ